MLKKLLILVVIIVVIFSGIFFYISSSSNSVISEYKKSLLETSAWKTSRNSDFNFSFKYPSDFGYEGSHPLDAFNLTKPNKKITGDEVINGKYVQIEISPNKTQKVDFKKLGVNANSYIEYLKISSNTSKAMGKDITIGGKPGYISVYKNKFKQSNWTQAQAYVQNSYFGILFVFTFRNLPLDQSLVDSILSTVKFE